MKYARKPVSSYALLLLTLFLSVGGFMGGFALIGDTSGASVQMPLSFLEKSPFNNYLIPGIILLITMGLFPALVTFGLLFRPKWRWPQVLNIYRDRHWAWTFSLYQSIVLILWIDFQVMWIGYDHMIQTVYALLGVVLLIFTMLPSVMRHYEGAVTAGQPKLRNVRKMKLTM